MGAKNLGRLVIEYHKNLDFLNQIELESLEFLAIGGLMSENALQLGPLVSICRPRLRTLIFDQLVLQPNEAGQFLRTCHEKLPNLTEFHLYSITSQDWGWMEYIPYTSKSLEELTVGGNLGLTHFQEFSRSIGFLHNLKILNLSALQGSNIPARRRNDSPLLNYDVMGNLHTLRLEDWWCWGALECATLGFASMHRQTPNLKTLSIQGGKPTGCLTALVGFGLTGAWPNLERILVGKYDLQNLAEEVAALKVAWPEVQVVEQRLEVYRVNRALNDFLMDL